MERKTLSCIFGFGGLFLIFVAVGFLPSLGVFMVLVGHCIEFHLDKAEDNRQPPAQSH